MFPLHDPLPPAPTLGMIGDDLAGMANNHTSSLHDNLNAFTDQAPGNRITIGVQIDGAIRLDLADQITQLAERCPASQRSKCISFPRKTFDRRNSGRAVDTNVGNLPCPPVQVCFKCGPAFKTAASNRIPFYVADPALVLAFRAGAIGCAGTRREAPVSGKRTETVIEPHLARRSIMMLK